MSLSILYLEKFLESEKLSDNTKEEIKILLAAINDWPTPIISLRDYERELYNLIGEKGGKKEVAECILNINYSKNAWQSESLSQLIEIYRYYNENIPVSEIMTDLQEKLKK